MGADYQASETSGPSRSIAADVLLAGAAWIVAAVVSFSIAGGVEALFGALLAGLMLCIAVYDRRLFMIPDALVAAAAVPGFVRAGFSGPDTLIVNCLAPAVRGLALAAAFLLVRNGYRYWRKREGVGLGDVKLSFAAGLWLGWPALLLSFELAVFSALGVILFNAARGVPVRRDWSLPFGLFFAPAIWLAWVFETVMS